MADNVQVQSEKLLKYGKKQLSDKGVTAQPTTLREVLDEIANIEAGAGGDYDVQSIPLEDGTQKIVVTTVAGAEKPKDMLQARVDGDNSCAYLFYNYTGTELDISRLVVSSNITDMSSMFEGCNNLTTVDVTKFNTSNVTNMSKMFYNCTKLVNLDVSKFNTNKVTNMSSMFESCSKLTNLNVSNFDTSKVTNMIGMFRSCKLTTLDLSNFDTSDVTNMSYMFSSCTELTSLDLSSFDTSNVTNMNNMFAYCQMTTITGIIDMIKVTSCSSIFQNCNKLIDVTFKNIKVSLKLGSGTTNNPNLSDNTIINTFQELHDLTDEETQTLTLSTPTKTKIDAIYVKLIEATDEMIANDPYITSKKPCIVCESTDEGAMTLREYGISKNWNIA